MGFLCSIPNALAPSGATENTSARSPCEQREPTGKCRECRKRASSALPKANAERQRSHGLEWAPRSAVASAELAVSLKRRVAIPYKVSPGHDLVMIV